LIFVQHQVSINVLICAPTQTLCIIASSVDAECAFSFGRLEVNHLQHSTSPQTFKAQVAVGSWAKTPLYPGLSETIKIVEKQMRGEQVEHEIEENDDEIDEEDEFWS
jgi:hypothetical protein